VDLLRGIGQMQERIEIVLTQVNFSSFPGWALKDMTMSNSCITVNMLTAETSEAQRGITSRNKSIKLSLHFANEHFVNFRG